ncbi:DUF3060 domain-containing protein [Actinomyces bowdenii]|uniref:DUF3060 domain-containing protein n=1 Tax=Actinomyces bowdenii TaxID=131109 RepID=UPI00214CD2D4|nr:DUF3060 domain-containing protein [Actinomyces bowdenii]MCR2051373.1 DUF3060 domain-containing protein [Actinomyces bowdenii]
MSMSTRRCLTAVAATALSLSLGSSLGACAISLGDSQGSPASGQASGQQQDAAPQTSQAPSAQQEVTPAASQAAAPTGGAAVPDAEPGSSQQPAAGADQTAQPGGAGGSDAAPASGERPGATATITDSDWLSFEGSVDKTVRSTGAVLLDKEFDDVRIDGDVATLTITANSVEVVVDYVDTLVIKGTFVDVYVRDVNRVIIHGDSNEVVWAGNTPQVEDFGTFNDTGLQGTRD